MPSTINQLTVSRAVATAPDAARALQQLAPSHRQQHTAIDQHQTIRHWQADAGTFCYQTHIAISKQPPSRLASLAEFMYNAATLKQQAWYPQFQGGATAPLSTSPLPGIDRHQLAWGCFDLGLPAPRYYRQLVSLARPDPQTAILVARSTDDGPSLPAGVPLAYTLDPNGEVFYWADDCLHWHHICCTPGAAILPGRLDRWLINSLRWLGLDQAERQTYREEAEQLRDLLQLRSMGSESVDFP